MKDLVNSELKKYVEQEIIPRYAAFDQAHRQDHVRAVIERALELAAHYDVDVDIIYAAAACHDLGLAVDRKTHHIESGRIIRSDSTLLGLLGPERLETAAQAAEDHRASSATEPRSIYGRIVAEADRLIEPLTIIRRTVQYGLEHYPGLDKDGHWHRTLEHLKEKYGDGGYLKLWIPESSNAARLEELRRIIRDEKELKIIFEQIWSELS